MYREHASDPIVDPATGVTLVALPFLHFKDTHKFEIATNKNTLRVSCHIIFDPKFRERAHLFGDKARSRQGAPIYTVHSIRAVDKNGEEIPMSGPEREAAFNDILPLFGRLLLRFRDSPAIFIKPSFDADYFKSAAQLQTEDLQRNLEWAHTYIALSRLMMKRYKVNNLDKLRTKLGINRLPDEGEFDFQDRIEAVYERIEPPEGYFVWSHWAEQSVETIIESVAELLSPEARTSDLRALLFADFLTENANFPKSRKYVAARFKALRPGLLTAVG